MCLFDSIDCLLAKLIVFSRAPDIENTLAFILYQLFGIDNKTPDSLEKSKNITLLTMEKLCNILNCSPNDIVRFIEEE